MANYLTVSTSIKYKLIIVVEHSVVNDISLKIKSGREASVDNKAQYWHGNGETHFETWFWYVSASTLQAWNQNFLLLWNSYHP